MLCFAQTWQFVQCWYTDFFIPFQWYLFFRDAYVLLNPLWPCLSCARIKRQSFRACGTTTGVYNSPLSTSFRFKMLFSIGYMFWSKFLFSHCFLNCLVCGSLSCNLASLSSFRGRSISVFISIGSVCWMFMLPISHSITSSTICVVTGGSSSNGKYPNSFPSSSGWCLMFSSISISLDKVSAKVFWIPGMYSNVMFCDSISTARLFTLEFRVFFSKNFFNGMWSLLTVILAVLM